MRQELLKQEALENFLEVYSFDKTDEETIRLTNNFEDCWNQLKTDEERCAFKINCCYYIEDNKCKIYFHVFDYNKDSYRDISLKQFRLMDRTNIAIYPTIL